MHWAERLGELFARGWNKPKRDAAFWKGMADGAEARSRKALDTARTDRLNIRLVQAQVEEMQKDNDYLRSMVGYVKNELVYRDQDEPKLYDLMVAKADAEIGYRDVGMQWYTATTRARSAREKAEQAGLEASIVKSERMHEEYLANKERDSKVIERLREMRRKSESRRRVWDEDDEA